MKPDIILVSIISSVITAIFVAGVNHFWNRRYLFAVEREKYRQTIFAEKLKVYVSITASIHVFIVFAAETMARLESNKTDNFSQQLLSVYKELLKVQSLINANLLFIPQGALDDITTISEMFHKVVECTKATEAIKRIEILTNGGVRLCMREKKDKENGLKRPIIRGTSLYLAPKNEGKTTFALTNPGL